MSKRDLVVSKYIETTTSCIRNVLEKHMPTVVRFLVLGNREKSLGGERLFRVN